MLHLYFLGYAGIAKENPTVMPIIMLDIYMSLVQVIFNGIKHLREFQLERKRIQMQLRVHMTYLYVSHVHS